MDVGQLIEFSVAGGHRLGVVTCVLNKRKLIVRTEDGEPMRPLSKHVTFEVPGMHADPSIPGESDRVLGTLRAQCDEVLDLLNIEAVWELAISTSSKPMSLHDLSLLIFDTAEPAQLLALQHALRADHIYFRHSRREAWEARPAHLIAQSQQQEAAAARQTVDLERFLTRIADAQKLATRQERAEWIRPQTAHDESFRDRLSLLQQFAAADDMFARREQADDLLDALAARPDIKIHGSGTLRAFNLMVELGLWTTHENTWLYRFQIHTDIPESLLEDARQIAARPWSPEPWRKDLTRTLCVTIDDASTLDLDDALSCVPRIDGGWDVGIHIADPSAFVAAGSPLDLSARGRGTSIYLPVGTIPMFPRELSEHAMSLVAGEPRPAMTTLIQFDRDLHILDVEVFPSTVCVDHRMTYDEVDALLARDPTSPIDVALHDLLFLTDELFHLRHDEGAISFDIPEARIVVTPAGPATHAGEDELDPEVHVEVLSGESPSRTLVAEAMIQAGASMARFCHRHQIPVIYRSQDAPDEDIFDDEVMSMPEGLPRTFAMLRKMKRGGITTRPERHFGLGLDMYVQATSPIRRYADLICQRQVKAHLTGEPLPYSPDEILQIAADVERATRDALQASRGTALYWAYHHLHTRKEETFTATVLDHREEHVAFIFIDALALRTKCTTHRRHSPGEQIDIVIERVHARRELLKVKEA